MSYTPTEWEPTDVVTATRMNALEQAVGDMNMSYTPNTWSDGDILSAEKMNALEQAVASGGGGSSDFSTAMVTFTSSSGAYAVLCAVILEEDQMIAINPITVDNTSVTAVVPLYKGTLGISMDCFVSLDSQTIPTVTGGVALDENGVIITADGTFTAVGS